MSMHVFRLHGRGGQGIDIARKILGRAAFLAGFCVQDFTLHPSERRTQPTVAYVKASKDPIMSRAEASPDFILAFDSSLDVLANVNGETVAIFNAEKPPKQKKVKNYYLPATDIALTKLKSAYPNTTMLGALCKIFPKLSLRNMKHGAEIELPGIESAAAMDEGFRSVKKG